MKPRKLSELETKLSKYYANMRAKMERGERTYRRHFADLGVSLPEGVKVHEASTGTTIIDVLRDQIRTDQPKVEFDAVGSGTKATAHKAKMEMWGNGVLASIPQATMFNPFPQGPHDLLLRGAACWKHVVDMSRLPDPPERSDSSNDRAHAKALREWRLERAAVWPFDVRAVDPLAVYVSPGSRRPPTFVLERQEWVLADAVDDFETFRTKDNDSPARRIKVYEYWSAPIVRDGKVVEDGYHIVEADGQRVIDDVNPYGFAPYVWSYSGLGRAHASGDPEAQAVGALDPIMGELEAEVRIKTAADAQWQFHVFPRLLTEDDPNRAKKQFQKGAGAVIKVTDITRKPEWLETPAPSAAMYTFLNEVKESIFRRIPPALFQRPEGVDSGIHQALLIGQSVKIIGPIVASLNQMGTDLITGMARQVAVMGLDMNVTGTTERTSKERMVSAKDFTSFNFRVLFEASDPVENDRRMLAGVSVMREGLNLMSRRTYREIYLKNLLDSPIEEEERILAEKIIDQMVESGAMLEIVMQELAQREAAGTEQDLQGALRAKAGQVAGEVAGGGTPQQVTERVAGLGGGELGTTLATGAQEGLRSAGL